MTKQQNDEIDKLYKELFNSLLGYAQSCLHNEALAEEAVQDTFHIACMKPDELLASNNPRGWIRKTLKNVIHNTWRKQETAKRVLADYYEQQVQMLRQTEDHIDFEALYQNVAGTEEFRMVREMELGGKTYREMSQEQGITLGTARKRIQRAKEFLRKKLKK